jgi:hypothetical protein
MFKSRSSSTRQRVRSQRALKRSAETRLKSVSVKSRELSRGPLGFILHQQMPIDGSFHALSRVGTHDDPLCCAVDEVFQFESGTAKAFFLIRGNVLIIIYRPDIFLIPSNVADEDFINSNSCSTEDQGRQFSSAIYLDKLDGCETTAGSKFKTDARRAVLCQFEKAGLRSAREA